MKERVALEARGVSKRYADRDALGGVDLVVEAGQLHGLLGPNGAGKTTLMRVLLGLVRRDAGTVRLLGRDLDSTGRPVADGVAGFVDTPAFYPYLSGRKNLVLLHRLDNATRFGGGDPVDAVLEQVGLAPHADQAVGGYSAGMRQRLGLAAALLRSPQLLFLDEPTSSLDPGSAKDIRTLARRLANEGTALVWCSHDMTEVEDLCSTLTVIDRGRLIFTGTVGNLRRLAPAPVHVLHTSDDRAALDIAANRHRLTIAFGRAGGLEVSADRETLDAYVIALARAGIAVRALTHRAPSLESLFLDLTSHADVVDAVEGTPCDAETNAREPTVAS